MNATARRSGRMKRKIENSVNYSNYNTEALKNMMKNSRVNKANKTLIRRILVERGAMKPLGRPPALTKYNTSTPAGKLGVAKALVNSGEHENFSDELFEANDDEEDQLLRVVPSALRAKFKNAWRELASKQVYNGSFLEFQGMRFAADAEVYDAERNDENGGRDVFAHIMEYSRNTKIYLKCRFSLDEVNKDTGKVSPKFTERWMDLKNKGKGVDSVEPDVVVKKGNTIRIFELKMGKGKKESGTYPKEAIQLMRCKRVFETFLGEENYDEIQMGLYFVGWSANSDAEVEFAPSKLETPTCRVTKINAAGMGKRTGINNQLVTAIVSELDRKRLKAFNKIVEKFIKPYGEYYTEYRTLVNSHKNIIRNDKNNYNVTINAPPLKLDIPKKNATGSKYHAAGTAAAVEAKMRKRARNVVRANNSNSNSESLSPVTRRRRIEYNLIMAGVSPEAISKTLSKINASQNREMVRAREKAAQSPEVRRLQANIKAYSPANSQNAMGINFNRQ